MFQPPDLSQVFAKYEALRASVDSLFQQIDQSNSGCVKCAKGCSDCCHALFDLSLVEALYINTKFNEKFSFGPERSAIIEYADESDRKIYKLKRKFFKDSQEGRDSNEILAEAGKVRMRCPLLNEQGNCQLYEYRPLTCRLYGIPVKIGGDAHSCAKSGFEPGKPYPTIDMEVLTGKLAEFSKEIVDLYKSPFTELPQVFVPLSMALLNKYDDEYFGLKEKNGAKK